ncbi:hypothetical protein GW17_00003559 [Ensete ventricosum]|nr:hypothetical protein GW17_00003559 [Ensete ventricosum]
MVADLQSSQGNANGNGLSQPLEADRHSLCNESSYYLLSRGVNAVPHAVAASTRWRSSTSQRFNHGAKRDRNHRTCSRSTPSPSFPPPSSSSLETPSAESTGPMKDFRSRSYNDGRMAAVPPPPSSLHDYRRSSTSTYTYGGYGSKGIKEKEAAAPSSSSNKGGWVVGDPDFQRRKRVASYKAYAVEGRVKGSVRRGFRWLNDKYTQIVYGWW